MSFSLTQNSFFRDSFGFPLWDTLELFFFFFFGFSVGVAFGFLIPSAWRTFRRRFRNVQKYVPSVDINNSTSLGRFFVSEKEIAQLSNKSYYVPFSNREIEKEFIYVHNCLLAENYLEAVSSLLQILKSKNVSKSQTNRALFSLASAYFKVGLNSIAYDIAIDFLLRRPKSSICLNLILDILNSEKNVLETSHLAQKLSKALKCFEGFPEVAMSIKVSRLLCFIGECFVVSNPQTGLEWARKAKQWWSRSGEVALLLLKLNIVINAKQEKNLSLSEKEAFIKERIEISNKFNLSLSAEALFFRTYLGYEVSEKIDHQCSECNAIFDKFYYTCRYCGGYETLKGRVV
jgi:hypothetical protein